MGRGLVMTRDLVREARHRIIAGERVAKIAGSMGVVPQTIYSRFPRAALERLRKQGEKPEVRRAAADKAFIIRRLRRQLEKGGNGHA